MTDRDGQISGYSFYGDPAEVFEYFFGTTNPDVVALDEQGMQVKLLEKIESDLHKDAVTDQSLIVTKDLHATVSCSLDEFFYGSTKQLNYYRETANPAGKGKSRESVMREIEIKPGMKPGMTFRFPGEGNTAHN